MADLAEQNKLKKNISEAYTWKFDNSAPQSDVDKPSVVWDFMYKLEDDCLKNNPSNSEK